MKTIHKISGIFLWLYETWSAPWYTGILRDGVIAAVLIAVTLAVRWVIQRKMRKE